MFSKMKKVFIEFLNKYPRKNALKEVVSQVKIDDVTLGLGVLDVTLGLGVLLDSTVYMIKQEIMEEVRKGISDEIKEIIYVTGVHHYVVTVEAILQDDKKSVKEFKVSYETVMERITTLKERFPDLG